MPVDEWQEVRNMAYVRHALQGEVLDQLVDMLIKQGRRGGAALLYRAVTECSLSEAVEYIRTGSKGWPG